MGIDYRAVLAVGKLVDGDYEVKEFFNECGVEIPEDAEEDIEEDGIGEWLYGQEIWPELECITLNHYNGWGRVIGYEIALAPYESFAERIKEAQEKFKALFGVDGDVISRVSVY